MYKRLLTFLLVLCLTVGAMPNIPTLAATPQPEPSTTEDFYITDPLCTADVTECDCIIFIIVFFQNLAYNPHTLKGTQPDPHWTIHAGNMIFGDSPTMRNNRYIPSIHAILQSGNLYMFTMHDPVNFTDPSGLFAIPFPIIPSLATLAKKVAAAIAATAAGAAATDYAIHGSNSAVGQAATGLSNTFGSITAPNPVVQNRATSIATSATTTQARNEPITVARPDTRPRAPQQTLFHATSPANAALIMASGQLIGRDAKLACAWQRKPTRRAVAGSGANINLQNMVLISFQTTAPFERDHGIIDPYVVTYNPVRAVHPGPVPVRNVVIIHFAWW